MVAQMKGAVSNVMRMGNQPALRRAMQKELMKGASCPAPQATAWTSSFLPPHDVNSVAEKKATNIKLASVNFTFFINNEVSVPLS
jgi:hypothetical protein